MKTLLKVLCFWLVFSLVKLPLERAAAGHLRQAGLTSASVNLGLRENLGQMGFAAALGGLRSLLASICYLRGYAAWEVTDWAQVDRYFQLTTRLQPRFSNYWDEASWHMAYNAASHYRYDESRSPFLREKLFYEHVQRGVAILQEGLRYLPEDPRLMQCLAKIYRDRLEDPVKAGEWYERTFQASQDGRAARFAGYEYAKCSQPEYQRRAYRLLRRAYDLKQRPPSVITQLKQLELKLNIPFPQRIPDPPPPDAVQRQ
jgi:hypothetical protein